MFGVYGVIMRPYIANMRDMYGGEWRVRTITNLAFLKHVGVPPRPFANDNQPERRLHPA